MASSQAAEESQGGLPGRMGTYETQNRKIAQVVGRK